MFNRIYQQQREQTHRIVIVRKKKNGMKEMKRRKTKTKCRAVQLCAMMLSNQMVVQQIRIKTALLNVGTLMVVVVFGAHILVSIPFITVQFVPIAYLALTAQEKLIRWNLYEDAISSSRFTISINVFLAGYFGLFKENIFSNKKND